MKFVRNARIKDVGAGASPGGVMISISRVSRLAMGDAAEVPASICLIDITKRVKYSVFFDIIDLTWLAVNGPGQVKHKAYRRVEPQSG